MGLKILIIGANGGIGMALTKHLAKRGDTQQIYATYRQQQPQIVSSKLSWHQLDVTDEPQVEHLAADIGPLDWVINTVGLLHNQQFQPEKCLSNLDPDFFIQNMTTNVLPTLLLAKHLAKRLKRSHAAKFAVLSAKVGSIGDNHKGGWYSYRSSKAALNMVVKTLSIEWARTMPNGCVLALHPGTTDTPLSHPFQNWVPAQQLFSPDKTAQLLLERIDGATPEQSGQFVAYNGEVLPW